MMAPLMKWRKRQKRRKRQKQVAGVAESLRTI